jgi:tetratricopeptide (TPR) repeat protein
MEAADAQEAATCLDAFDRLSAAVHQPTMLWYVTYMQASRAMLDGRFDDAEQLATEAFHLGQAAGQPDADLFLSVQRLQLAFERGTLRRWDRPLRIALARDPESWWFLRSWQALCALERGDRDGAQAFLDELAAHDFTDLAFEPTWLHIVANCGTVAAELGDTARVARVADLMAPYAGQMVTLSSLAYCGAVDHYLGVLAAALGRHDEADGHFASAAAIHQHIGAPAWLARTRLAWARSLFSRGGRPDEAARLLEQAAATAEALGLAAVARAVTTAGERRTLVADRSRSPGG